MKQTALTLLALLLLVPTASARPHPDRLGICYLFKANKLTTRAPCVLTSGYGTGEQYLTLTLNNKEYDVEINTTDDKAPPRLNGKPAIWYMRDASFLDIHKGPPDQGEEYVNCYKTKDAQTDICYLLVN